MPEDNNSDLEDILKNVFAANSQAKPFDAAKRNINALKKDALDSYLSEDYFAARSLYGLLLATASKPEDRAFCLYRIINCARQEFHECPNEHSFYEICRNYELLLKEQESPSAYLSYIKFLGNDLMDNLGFDLHNEAKIIGERALFSFPDDTNLNVEMHEIYRILQQDDKAYDCMMTACKLNYLSPKFLYSRFSMGLFNPRPGTADMKTSPFSILLNYKKKAVLFDAGLLCNYADIIPFTTMGKAIQAMKLYCRTYTLDPHVPDIKENIMMSYEFAIGMAATDEQKNIIHKKFRKFCMDNKLTSDLDKFNPSNYPLVKLVKPFESVKSPQVAGQPKQEGTLGERASGISILLPKKIKQRLDEYVIGQEDAKKSLSVAIYSHFLRIQRKSEGKDDLEKSNILILGPTGCGKTHIARTLARIANVPFVIFDTSKITSAGYVGGNAEDCLESLYAVSGNNLDATQNGIIYLDEADKIKVSKGMGKDVGGEGAQQQFLKLLEGSIVNVDIGKDKDKKTLQINTSNILFIVGGAFSDTESGESLRQRISGRISSRMGFNQCEEPAETAEIFGRLTDKDLQAYGFLPEFAGRLQHRVVMNSLNANELKRILTEPVDALIPQYVRLFDASGIKLDVIEDALEVIAREAFSLGAGARSLRTICEPMFTEPLFEMPGTETKELKINKDYVLAFLKK